MSTDEAADAVTVVTDSPAATRALAERVGRACRGGEVLLLDGPLGAGKTCFTQGLARGLDVPPDPPVTSPTFVLHAVYPGRLALHHVDGYRLRDAADADALGFEECFGAAGAVAAVEWPDCLEAALPRRRLRVVVDPAGEASRRFRFTVEPADDEAHRPLLDALRDAPA